MNLAFSEEQEQLRQSLRRMLADRCGSGRLHDLAVGAAPFDRELWVDLAGSGLQGARIPEALNGVGAGFLELCVFAEELGRVIAPIPLIGSVFLATEALLLAGSEEQQRRYLPALAAGGLIGAMVVGSTGLALREGRLFGETRAVVHGASAQLAVALAEDGDGASLCLVDLRQTKVRREAVEGLDPLTEVATIQFQGALCEQLGAAGGGAEAFETILLRAAVLVAFNQLGGAQAALEAAVAFAKDRKAFGRAIGSYQAIKHMLADMYVAVELARSNCFHAAWALESDSPDLAEAAATARLSATRAYQHVSRNNTQVHGGYGFTWGADCHLHYRRSALLGLVLGSEAEWETRLVQQLKIRNAA